MQPAQAAQETQQTSMAQAQVRAPSTAQTMQANAPGTAQTPANAPSTAQMMQTASAGAAPQAALEGPETMGNWNWAVAQPGVNASPSETEGSIQSASTQIAQAYGSGTTSPADIRNASEAYRNEASARDQAAQQQQGGGTRTLDVFA
jgi:hypothetical protein